MFNIFGTGKTIKIWKEPGIKSNQHWYSEHIKMTDIDISVATCNYSKVKMFILIALALGENTFYWW